MVFLLVLTIWFGGPLIQAGPKIASLPPFVFENGNPSQYQYNDGVLSIRSGPGWVRSRQVFSSFVLTTEFRLLDSRAAAGVGIRTLTSPGLWPSKGYRLVLSAAEPARIEAKGRPAAPLSTPIGPFAPGAWHKLVVTGAGARVTVTVDDGAPSVATIDDSLGSILFHVGRGAAEFRHIEVRVPGPNGQAQYDSGATDATGDARLVISPVLVKEVKPDYTRSAAQRKIEGIVELEILVLEDGRVGDVSLVTALDPELEHQAVLAVRQWRFRPATLRGSPVPCIAHVEMTFTLK